MEEPIEVVICHEILAVPFEETTQYVWAATQTFTIKHILDDSRTFDSDIGESVNTTFECSDERMLERLQWLAENSHSDSINVPSSLRIVAVEGAQPHGDDVNENLQNSIEIYKTKNDETENPFHKDSSQNSEDNILDAFDNRGSEDHSYILPEDGEYFPCGVCDQLFEDELRMHSHRVEHFGYMHWKFYQNRACVFCGDPFRDIRSMSNHLYNHFPEMQINRKKRTKAQTLRNTCDNQPVEADSSTRTNHSFESQFHDALTEGNSKNTLPDVDLSATRAEHRNYPTTNNDRLDDEAPPINNIIDSSSKYNHNTIVANRRKCLQSSFKCGVCDVVFGIEIKMHKHRIRHFGYFRTTPLMKCVFCGDLFSCQTKISEHLYQHYLKS